MKMKRLFVFGLAVMFMFGVGNAWADIFENGDGAIGVGFFKINAKAKGCGLSGDFQGVPGLSGLAVGGGLAGGNANGGAKGAIYNGTVSGNIGVVAGGASETNTILQFGGVPDTDFSVQVGVRTDNIAAVHGLVGVEVDPGPEGCGIGMAGGGFRGEVGQASLSISALENSPLPMWTSDGHTGGIAAQGSYGQISGCVFAFAMGYDGYYYGGEEGGPGYYVKLNGKKAGKIKYFKNGHPPDPSEWEFLGLHRNDVKAGAEAGAGIDMLGFSYSESYRAINFFDGGKTEYMGTYVGAGTLVNSYRIEDSWQNGEGRMCSYANVQGGWIAGGIAASRTEQHVRTGGAEASALGVYFGAGDLGTNYVGSANGGTHTSVTTFDGMNGSINSAGANMSVTSSVSGNQPQ